MSGCCARMKRRYCEIEHNPPHSYGDCVRACVATVINRDDVPHTYKGDSHQAWLEMRDYLKEHGKSFLVFASGEPYDGMLANNPDIPYILMGKSSTGSNHAVVCINNKIIHDPSRTPIGITEPTELGVYIIGVIGSL